MRRLFTTRRVLVMLSIGAALGALATGATGIRMVDLHLGRLRAHNRALRTEADDTIRDSVWIIVNPTKHKNLRAFKARVQKYAARRGVRTIHWLDTRPNDPGVGQALHALRHGATLVIAAGGDGTVRAVAAGMAHSGVRMGIIPVGTGNIFARNINLPIGKLDAAVGVALGSHYRTVDLGWLRPTGATHNLGFPAEGSLVCAQTDGAVPGEDGLPRDDEYSYVVVSGVGYDAQTMADTDPKLKKKIGWLAYVVSGTLALNTPRMDAHLTLWDDPKAAPSEEGDVTAKSIMFANVGQLPFMTLAPDASMDDEKLDIVGVDVTAGLIGWMSLGWKFFLKGLELPAFQLPASPGRLAFRQARMAQVTVTEPTTVEVDGDAIAIAGGVITRIDPGALHVSAPDVTIPW